MANIFACFTIFDLIHIHVYDFTGILSSYSTVFGLVVVTRRFSLSCFFLILCYFKSFIKGGKWGSHLLCLIVKLHCSL